MSIGVLALVRLSPERLAALTGAGYEVREASKYGSRMDAIRDAGDRVRAVLTNGRGGLSGAEMALLPKLEFICAVSAGYEAVDLETARSRGIAVANSPDTNASAVADSAMMLLMAATRHVREADRFLHAGGWQDHWRIDTPTISGKRLGILGLGKIGRRIAHRAADGFDMEVGYHNRSPVADCAYRYFDSLVELATWVDFLVCCRAGRRWDATSRQRGRSHRARAEGLCRERRTRHGRGHRRSDRCAGIEAHCRRGARCARRRTGCAAASAEASAIR